MMCSVDCLYANDLLFLYGVFEEGYKSEQGDSPSGNSSPHCD